MAVPQLEDFELWLDIRGTPHLRGKYEHGRPQGAWQTEDQFSDGTLRLMGLLWAARKRHATVSAASFELDPALVSLVRAQDELHMVRTGCAGLGVPSFATVNSSPR